MPRSVLLLGQHPLPLPSLQLPFPCLCPLRAPRWPVLTPEQAQMPALAAPCPVRDTLQQTHTLSEQPAGWKVSQPEPCSGFGALRKLQAEARDPGTCGMHRVPAHVASARVSWQCLQELLSRLQSGVWLICNESFMTLSKHSSLQPFTEPWRK